MFEYSFMSCLSNKSSFKSKMASKCIRIASTYILNLKNFSRVFPRTPLREGVTLSRALPHSTTALIFLKEDFFNVLGHLAPQSMVGSG